MRPSRILALILVVLVFPATVWAQQTIYACVKTNNGQVRIVSAGEQCLPSERAMQWQSGGPSVTPPAATTPGPLKVVDQNGAALGYLVTGGAAAKLVGDLWLGLPIGATGFSVTDPTSFMAFYTTTDCSGDAYLPVDTTTILRTGFVMATGTGALGFYYPGKPEVQNTAIQSYAMNGSCGLFSPGPWMPLFGKVVILDVSTFKPPFKIVQ